MVDHERLDSVRQTGAHAARLTLGLLLDNAWDPIAWEVWAAVDDAAKEADVNLLCFVGGALHSPVDFDAQANVLYNLVSAETVDGLVLWAGGLARFVSPKEWKAFSEQYRPLPMTAAALSLEGIPSVTVDNYLGMRQAVTHLVDVHGYRRIAFIRGPEGHSEAEERYRAYVDVLAEHGLSLDPNLVTSGDFPDSAVQAVQTLLDERQLATGTDIEAIAVVDDAAAIATMEALQARGIWVPDEIAVVGFGNTEMSSYVTPPLTTAPALAYTQARRATEMVLASLAGEDVPERVTLSTELVVRQSCGCLDPMIAQAAVEPEAATRRDRVAGKRFEIAFAARRGRILSNVVQAITAPGLGLDPTWAEHLLGAFAVEVGGEAPGAFLATLDRALRRASMSGGSVSAWQEALSTLRQQALPCLANDATALSRAENLWQQARVMIGGMAERAGVYRALQMQQLADLMRQMDQDLMTVVDLSELADVLARDLPRLGIPSCYLSLYEDPDSPAGWSRLIMAYDGDGRVELERGGLRFPSRHLAPGGMYRRAERYSMVLDPLYFRKRKLGFVVLEMDPGQAEIHAPLAVDFSTALQKTLLVQRVEDHAVQLEAGAEVSRAAGSILDLDELIQKAVGLIRERFDLYYVGLFLVDEAGEAGGERTSEPGRWAVLRAGTGESGRIMVQEGHRLEVGGESMIGWCVANAQARIALDVADVKSGDVKSGGVQPGEEAVRFDNPLLPETRSEMALPFVCRGRVIGAMTIQSTEPAAFTQENITALQTMADQLANAIENARLFEERERRLTELAIVNEIGQAFSSALEMGDLLKVVYQQVGRLFDTTNFYIATHRQGSNEWVSALHIENGERQPTARYSIEAGLTGYIIRTREPLLFRTEKENTTFHEAQGTTTIGPRARSWLGVPLIAADKLVGVMGIQNYEHENLYGEQDLALFSTIAAQVANALENLWLLDETWQRASELGALHEMSLELAQEHQDLDAVLETITRRTLPLLDSDGGGIWLWRKEDQELELVITFQAGDVDFTGRRLEPGEGLAGRAFVERKIQVVDDYPSWAGKSSAFRDVPFHSAIAAPMIRHAQVVGTLVATRSQAGRPYVANEQDLVELLATQAAAVIEDTRLHEETEHRLNELAMLFGVSQALASAPLQAEEIAGIVCRQFVEVMGIPEASISLLDPDGTLRVVIDVFADPADIEIRREFEQETFYLADYPATARVMETQQPLVVHASDPDADPAELTYMQQFHIDTLAIFPLTVKGQTIGVVELETWDGEHFFTPQELDLAMTLTNQVAVALENARLFEQEQARAEELAVLNEVGQAIVSMVDLDAVLRQIVDTIKERFGYFFVGILLIEEGQLVFRSSSVVGDSDVRWERGEQRLDLDEKSLNVVAVTSGESVLVNDVSQSPQYRAAEGLEPVRAELDTPIVARGSIIGTLTVQSDRLNAFDEADVALHQSLASQAGAIIDNARLFKETQGRAREMEAINEIGRTIASVLDLEELLRQVTDLTKARFGHYFVSIMLVEGDQLTFHHGSTIGDTDARFEPGKMTIDLAHGPSLNAEAVRTNRPVLVNNALEDPRYLPLAELPDTRSELDVPIEVKGQVIGVLGVQSDRPFAYDQTDVALTQSLANQVGAAIDNARLFEETRTRAEELAALNEMSRALSARLDTEAVVENLYHYTSRLMDATNFYVALYDAERDEVSFPFYAEGDQVSQGEPRRARKGLTEHVIHTREPLLIKENVDAWLEEQGIVSIGTTAESWLGAPLAIGQRVVGVVAVQSYTTPRLYDERDRDLLATIASQAAIALHNARLFEAEQEASAQLGQRVQELNTLNDIGRKIDETPPLPEFLQWVSERIPLAMQRPDRCVAAIEYEGELYGVAEAVDLPSQIVQSLYAGGRRVGRICIAYRKETDFLDAESALIGDISRRVSGYVENQHLLQETQRRVREMEMLYDVSVTAASGMALDEALQASVETIAAEMGYPIVDVELVEPATRMLHLRASVGYEPVAISAAPLPLGEGITGWVAQSGEPLLVSDVRQDPRYVETIAGIRSEMCVPLIVGQHRDGSGTPQIIGVLNAESPRPGAFAEDDLRLLGTVASNLSALVERLRLFEEARIHAEELAVLNELGQALTARLSVEEVLGEAYRQASRLVDTTNFYVALYDANRHEIDFVLDVIESERDAEITTIPADQGLAGYIVRNRQPVLIQDDTDAWHEETDIERVGGRSRSWLGVPLLVGDQVLGVMAVHSYTTPNLYDEHDRDLLTAVAGPMAIAIQNARLFEAEQNATLELGRRVQELDILNDIGRKIDETPPIPEFLQWLTEHVPAAMQYPGLCVVAVEFEDQVYGSAEALGLPSQMVQGLRIGSEQVGKLCIAYTAERGFLDEESAMLGDVARRVSSYIENRHLFEQTQHRTVQLQTAAEVSQAASSILSVADLVDESVNLIRDRFDFYYVGLFLLNGEGDFAVLRAGTGEAGRIMVEEEHKLRVGGESMIGRCIADKQAHIALDVADVKSGEEAIRFDNPLLPDTRSEMALPLISRGKVLGALTVQSVAETAFSEDDVAILQTMGDQLANAIANARLFTQAERSARQSQALYETSRALSAQLEEERLMRTILKAVYQTIDCEHANISIADERAGIISSRHLIYRGEFDTFPEWIQKASYPLDHPDIVADVYRTGRTEIIGEWDERFNREIWEKFGHERFLRIFMPIQVRDRVLGVIEVGYDKQKKQSIGEDEVQLLATFMDQAAVALEQARLFEEAQTRARREQTLRQITARVHGSTDADVIMRTAVRELGAALGRPTFVRLGSVEEWGRASTAQTGDDGGQDRAQEGGE